MPNIDDDNSTMHAHKFLAALSPEEAFRAMIAYKENNALHDEIEDLQSRLAEVNLHSNLPQPNESERLLYELEIVIAGCDRLDAVTTPSEVLDTIRALRSDNAQLRAELATANGALKAADEMQNAQINQWRERLRIPAHIVACSDVVDDLCEHFASQLASARNEVKRYEKALEWLACTEDFDSLHKNWKTKMYALCRLSPLGRDDGMSIAMCTPLDAIEAAMKEPKNGNG